MTQEKMKNRALLPVIILVAIVMAVVLIVLVSLVFGLRYKGMTCKYDDNTSIGVHFVGRIHGGEFISGKVFYSDGTSATFKKYNPAAAEQDTAEGSASVDLTASKPTLVYGNGDKYYGPVDEYLLPDGKGLMLYESKDSYEGDFLHGRITGEGTWIYEADGSTYHGTLNNGKREGHGVYEYGDGSSYEGDFYDNMRDGYGTAVYPNGDVYEGRWTKDLRNGKSVDDKPNTYTWANGDFYVGDFVNDMRTGKGTMTWVWEESGNRREVYVGDFVDNMPEGQGTYYWYKADGTSEARAPYTGRFSGGLIKAE